MTAIISRHAIAEPESRHAHRDRRRRTEHPAPTSLRADPSEPRDESGFERGPWDCRARTRYPARNAVPPLGRGWLRIGGDRQRDGRPISPGRTRQRRHRRRPRPRCAGALGEIDLRRWRPHLGAAQSPWKTGQSDRHPCHARRPVCHRVRRTRATDTACVERERDSRHHRQVRPGRVGSGGGRLRWSAAPRCPRIPGVPVSLTTVEPTRGRVGRRPRRQDAIRSSRRARHQSGRVPRLCSGNQTELCRLPARRIQRRGISHHRRASRRGSDRSDRNQWRQLRITRDDGHLQHSRSRSLLPGIRPHGARGSRERSTCSDRWFPHPLGDECGRTIGRVRRRRSRSPDCSRPGSSPFTGRRLTGSGRDSARLPASSVESWCFQTDQRRSGLAVAHRPTAAHRRRKATRFGTPRLANGDCNGAAQRLGRVS